MLSHSSQDDPGLPPSYSFPLHTSRAEWLLPLSQSLSALLTKLSIHNRSENVEWSQCTMQCEAGMESWGARTTGICVMPFAYHQQIKCKLLYSIPFLNHSHSIDFPSFFILLYIYLYLGFLKEFPTGPSSFQLFLPCGVLSTELSSPPFCDFSLSSHASCIL